MVLKSSCASYKVAYRVELVDALTKQPFIEHTGSDGKVYVEVEPEADYFIKISSSVDPNIHKVLVDIEIDGNAIGCSINLWAYKDCTLWEGYYEQKNGEITELSLKFSKASKQKEKKSIDGCGIQLLMGKIVVTFSDAVPNGFDKGKDFETNLDPNEIELTSKSVETAKGSVVNDMNEEHPNYTDEDSKTRYISGKVREEIELNYCCAVSLINQKILPKPPLWEMHRLRAPETKNGKGTMTVEPKRIKIGAVVTNGVTLSPGKEVDFFDLTECCSSDEEFEDARDEIN